MNRELKFRAYQRLSKQMYWFDLMWDNKATIGGGYIAMLPIGEEREYGNSENRIAVDPDNCYILQFTGLQDNKQNDIYEGDIDQYGCIVEFYRGSFILKKEGNPTFIPLHEANIIEIVGNKYENPELCEKI